MAHKSQTFLLQLAHEASHTFVQCCPCLILNNQASPADRPPTANSLSSPPCPGQLLASRLPLQYCKPSRAEAWHLPLLRPHLKQQLRLVRPGAHRASRGRPNGPSGAELNSRPLGAEVTDIDRKRSMEQRWIFHIGETELGFFAGWCWVRWVR